MRLRLSETLDRLAILARVLTVVFGTKDKTVLNHVADGLEKAQTVRDVVLPPKKGNEGIVVLVVLVVILLVYPVLWMVADAAMGH